MNKQWRRPFVRFDLEGINGDYGTTWITLDLSIFRELSFSCRWFLLLGWWNSKALIECNILVMETHIPNFLSQCVTTISGISVTQFLLSLNMCILIFLSHESHHTKNMFNTIKFLVPTAHSILFSLHVATNSWISLYYCGSYQDPWEFSSHFILAKWLTSISFDRRLEQWDAKLSFIY